MITITPTELPDVYRIEVADDKGMIYTFFTEHDPYLFISRLREALERERIVGMDFNNDEPITVSNH